jgi:competence protein ComEA
MALLELETDAASRAGRESKSVTSRAPRGGSRSRAPAAAGALARAVDRFRKNVWAKLVLRIAGILGGMLALAAIGASSIARGSGVPWSAGSSAATASFLAGGLTPVSSPTAAASARAPGAASAAPAASERQAGGEPPATDAGTPAPNAGLTADGKVILNLAGPDQLRKLPGVGEKRAHAIVALRTKLGGRFKRVTDLLRVKGIGPKGLKKMEPHLVLDP